MNSGLLQNPADPDATYRAKAGKDYRGYIANVVEAADKNHSIAVDYQFEKNIYSDSQFVKDYLDKQPVSEEELFWLQMMAIVGTKMESIFSNRTMQNELPTMQSSKDSLKLKNSKNMFPKMSQSHLLQDNQEVSYLV